MLSTFEIQERMKYDLCYSVLHALFAMVLRISVIEICEVFKTKTVYVFNIFSNLFYQNFLNDGNVS